MPIDWTKKMEEIPGKPGVYIFRNRKGEPIYVGKANSLRSRLRSYFADSGQHPKTLAMLEHAEDVECIVVDTELEALILESNLIKQHRPKYNVLIKDDKRYPWLKFTYGEDFPRIYIVRLPRRDKHKYFGPYPKGGSLRQTLKLIHSIFRIRTCKLEIEEGKKAIERPCLEYDLKRCDAPCVCWMNKQEYRKICDQVCLFLEGRMDDVVRQLNLRMNQLAQDMKFEEAGAVRDQIESVKDVQLKQTMYTADAAERDILGAKWYGDTAVMAVFVTRNGKLIGKEKYRLDGTENLRIGEPENGRTGEKESGDSTLKGVLPGLLATFIKLHYAQPALIPKELLLPEHPEDEKYLVEWLSQLKGRNVEILVPERGEKVRLVQMAEQNAELHLQQELVRKNPQLGKMPQGLFELQKVLKLERLPLRIEAFDISNISGTDAVGSMVVLKNGVPSKSDYRKFKIKTVEGIDDFAMMKEVISRRMKYLYRESSLKKTTPFDSPTTGRDVTCYVSTEDKEGTVGGIDARGLDIKPDLVLIDGGKGQLNAALDAIRELAGHGKIPFAIIGLAKRLEEIYLPNHKDSIILPYENKALQLLQLIRDEAHRFAITYHRTLRGKKIYGSLLDELPGIGEKRKLLLLKQFGSVQELKQASLADLEKVPGLGKKLASELYAYLQTQ